VEDTDGGACEAEFLIELRAKKMVYALDHVLNDFFWRVPDAEFLPKVRVEFFKERLVEVGDGFVFTEGFKESRLHAVESFAREVENLLKLDGIQRPRVGYFAKEFAEDGDAQVVGGDAPVETGAGCTIFEDATPQNPGGENTVKEGLNESGAEKCSPFSPLNCIPRESWRAAFTVSKLPRG